ncbi:hypothetical protein FN846DRAFT_893168 [Sphaerosporella brunnea]|uniref:Uncharacterized protein n=1 Tax=Sphaerosporella brunnea TaxID=1250544 RepID=A0A5J5EM64_9PEZI|nr:hypothetical protein FN846DRAFT_893168 [Sphaerosporella brunnea]
MPLSKHGDLCLYQGQTRAGARPYELSPKQAACRLPGPPSSVQTIKAIRYYDNWMSLGCAGRHCRVAFHRECAGWSPSEAQADAARKALGDDADNDDQAAEVESESKVDEVEDEKDSEEEQNAADQNVEITDATITPRSGPTYIMHSCFGFYGFLFGSIRLRQ